MALDTFLYYGEHFLTLLGGLQVVASLGKGLARPKSSNTLPARQGEVMPAEAPPQTRTHGRRKGAAQVDLEALYPPPGRSMEVNDYEITITGRTTTLR